MIPLSIPNISGNEWKYVKECLDTNFVSTAGQFVGEFEKQFAKKIGVKHAIAVVNGTAAIHLSLVLCGVNPDDEVLVPNLTFIAPLNAVKYTGASPVLIDSCWDTLGIDVSKLEDFLSKNTTIIDNKCINNKTKKVVKAIIPMHTLGHAVDMLSLTQLCLKYNIKVIEDASESLGAKWGDKETGTWGSLGCFSFNGNKIMTCGGGGMIVTNDDALAKRAKHLSTTAKVDNINFVHDEVGYNYRMVNVLAAIGLAQLERIDEFLNIKFKNAKLYQGLIPKSNHFEFYMPKLEQSSNHWFYSIKLSDTLAPKRDHYIKQLIQSGVDVRPIWTLMNDLPMYSNCACMDLATSITIQKSIINIPCSTNLQEAELKQVVDVLQKVIK
tara:strand:- start:8029 stop:9174 length:1146 start_codon:yes stop_codon:yes gene_type:complete